MLKTQNVDQTQPIMNYQLNESQIMKNTLDRIGDYTNYPRNTN